MRSFSSCLSLFALLLVAAPLFATDQWIRADRLHVGDGRVFHHGVLHLRDGRIVAAGSDLAIPPDAAVLDLSGYEITPGLIDANARLEPDDLISTPQSDARRAVRALFGLGSDDEERFHQYQVCPSYSAHEADQICPICGGESDDPEDHEPEASGVTMPPVALTEQSSEVVPHTTVIETLDPSSPDFVRLLRGGVTTVYAAPDPSAVMGARGAIVRTAGSGGAEVIEREAAVKAVVGSDPYRFARVNRRPSIRSLTHFSRRPQSRMGVGWIFRKAFHDAKLRAEGGTPSGADTASADASAVLQRVLAAEIPLRVQARTASDIESAFRLCDEFGLSFTLVDPIEAYRVLPLLESRAAPVIFGPIFDEAPRDTLAGRSFGENRRSRLHTVRDLVNAGVPLALSAQDLREEDGLARQAMLAIRSGVSPAKALELVTLAPARILGLESEVGSLEPGKRADLVAWNGPPLAATSRAVHIFVDGRLVHGEL